MRVVKNSEGGRVEVSRRATETGEELPGEVRASFSSSAPCFTLLGTLTEMEMDVDVDVDVDQAAA